MKLIKTRTFFVISEQIVRNPRVTKTEYTAKYLDIRVLCIKKFYKTVLCCIVTFGDAVSDIITWYYITRLMLGFMLCVSTRFHSTLYNLQAYNSDKMRDRLHVTAENAFILTDDRVTLVSFDVSLTYLRIYVA